MHPKSIEKNIHRAIYDRDDEKLEQYARELKSFILRADDF
jgi:hypothetical protein